MDFFHYNFIFGFILLTALITAGIVTENLTVVSLPLSILVLYISLELLLAYTATSLDIPAPFRMSSVAKGAETRPGVFVIVEDVVAVDGGVGRAWREAWGARYEASPVMRGFLKRMDLVWGGTGLGFVGVVWGVVFGVGDQEVGYVVGWALPWVWAGVMTVATVWGARRMLRRERDGVEGSVEV